MLYSVSWSSDTHRTEFTGERADLEKKEGDVGREMREWPDKLGSYSWGRQKQLRSDR